MGGKKRRALAGALLLGWAWMALLAPRPVAGASPEHPPLASEDPEAAAGEQWRAVETPQLRDLFREIERDLAAPGALEVTGVIRRLREGGWALDLPLLARTLRQKLAGEVPAALQLLGRLVLLSLVAALLAQLGEALGGGSVARLAYLVCFLAFLGLAITSFLAAFAAARVAITRLVSLMLALIPPFLALTVAGGAPATAGLLHPALLLAVNGAGLVGVTVAMPLLFASALVELVDGLGERRRLEGVSALLKQGSVTVVGISMAAFLGVAVAQGAAGRAWDGVLLRSAKFVSGTFVPVVGKMFADATEMVFASARLVATGLGLAGMLAVAGIILFPLVKILLLILCYRLAAALVGVMEGGQLAWCLRGIASALSWLGVIVGVVSLMFLVGLAILVGAARPA